VQGLAERLRAATSTIDVVNAVIARAVPMLELEGVAVIFLDAASTPTLGITNWAAPDSIRSYLTEIYKLDPLLARVLATRRSHAVTDVLTIEQLEAFRPHAIPETMHVPIDRIATHVIAPMMGVGEVIGVIQFWPRRAADPEMRRRMDEIATQAAVRLAQLGVSCAANARQLGSLTPRQNECIDHVIAGLTNAEVANRLGISVDTVKKHLKLAFDQLGIHSRTELIALAASGVPKLASLHAGYFIVSVRRPQP
jgi:DNA-binding CsgD family transcriptional regulator